jgi:hypothetical protein
MCHVQYNMELSLLWSSCHPSLLLAMLAQQQARQHSPLQCASPRVLQQYPVIILFYQAAPASQRKKAAGLLGIPQGVTSGTLQMLLQGGGSSPIPPNTEVLGASIHSYCQ